MHAAVTERAAVTYGEKMAEELTGSEEGAGALGDGHYGSVEQGAAQHVPS